MKNLLVIHNSYIHAGGEDVCVQNEIVALREAGVDVFEFNVRNQSTLRSKTNAFLAPFGKGQEAELEAVLRSRKPEIIHAHNLFPLLSPRAFRAAVKLGIRCVLTLHNYRPLCLNGLFLTPRKEVCERCAKGNYWPGIVRGCYRGSHLQSAALAWHLSVARWARWYDDVHLFIAPSEFLRAKYLEYGFPADKIAVQPHFLPEPLPEAPATPAPYVLYIGRLSEEKGVRWLLRRFENPKISLTLKIAGDGPLEADVRRATGAHVEYLGYLSGSQKEETLRQALAVIVPSQCYESFSLAIAEANWRGVPALVSRQGAIARMIIPGENGEYYTPGDAESFWQKLTSIARAPDVQVLRRTSQNYARNKFSKSQFVAARIALYQTVLGAQHGL